MPKKEVYWYKSLNHSDTTKLQEKISCDVVVIGGGIAGLMCAQALSEQGNTVVVLEKDFVGSGASGKSSGFITPDSELELCDLFDSFGEKDAKRLWEFARGGVKAIKDNIINLQLDCDYQEQDSLFVASNKKGWQKVQYEHKIQNKLGYESKLYDAKSLHDVVGSKQYLGGIRYGQTFGIKSFDYCQQLKKHLQNNGVQIFEHTEVKNIQRGLVSCELGSVSAKNIVVCVDKWLGDLLENRQEVYHAQTFLTITKPLSSELIEKMFPENKLMVWDTDLVYQYYRVLGDNRLLLGGSSLIYTYKHHSLGSTALIENKLQKYLVNNFKSFEGVEFEYTWPGLIGVSKDFVPIAGSSEPGIYYVGGAAGLPWAAALGIYTAEKITTGNHDMDKFFTPNRNFFIGKGLQQILRKPLSFALSHASEKFLD